jgi:hypothetical protein
MDDVELLRARVARTVDVRLPVTTKQAPKLRDAIGGIAETAWASTPCRLSTREVSGATTPRFPPAVSTASTR